MKKTWPLLLSLLLVAVLIGGCIGVKYTYAPTPSPTYHDQGERSVHGTFLSLEDAQSFFDDHQTVLAALPEQIGDNCPQFEVFRGEADTLLCRFYTGDSRQDRELPLAESGLPQEAVDGLMALMYLPALRINYYGSGEDGYCLRAVAYTSYDRPADSSCGGYDEYGMTYLNEEPDPDPPWNVLLGDSWYYYETHMP